MYSTVSLSSERRRQTVELDCACIALDLFGVSNDGDVRVDLDIDLF